KSMANQDQNIELSVNEILLAHEEPELVPGTTSITRSITHAVVIKDEDVFFLCEPDGIAPLEPGHGFGLYYHDCRYLSGYELRLGGKKPDSLVWTADLGFMAVLGLSNRDIRTTDGRPLPKHSVEIKWSRMVSSERLALFDDIELRSLTFQPIEFTVALTFKTGFEDMFAIRGLFQGKRGHLRQPECLGDALRFAYDGADDLYRSLTIHFTPTPVGMNQHTAYFKIALLPKEHQHILVSLQMAETAGSRARQSIRGIELERAPIERALHCSSESFLRQETQVTSDSMMLNHIIERSMRDLGMLCSQIGKIKYFAAGVPWFVTLYGRDS